MHRRLSVLVMLLLLLPALIIPSSAVSSDGVSPLSDSYPGPFTLSFVGDGGIYYYGDNAPYNFTKSRSLVGGVVSSDGYLPLTYGSLSGGYSYKRTLLYGSTDPSFRAVLTLDLSDYPDDSTLSLDIAVDLLVGYSTSISSDALYWSSTYGSYFASSWLVRSPSCILTVPGQTNTTLSYSNGAYRWSGVISHVPYITLTFAPGGSRFYSSTSTPFYGISIGSIVANNVGVVSVWNRHLVSGNITVRSSVNFWDTLISMISSSFSNLSVLIQSKADAIVSAIQAGVKSIVSAVQSSGSSGSTPEQDAAASQFVEDVQDKVQEIDDATAAVESAAPRPKPEEIVPDISTIVDTADPAAVSFTAAFGSLLGSSMITNLLLLTCSMAFAGYVLFGKR